MSRHLIKRQLSEIIVADNLVFKRYYDNHLTPTVVKNLFISDKQFNLNPIFVDAVPDSKTPFNLHKLTGRIVLVMRKLRDKNQLPFATKSNNDGKLFSKLGKSLALAHSNATRALTQNDTFLEERFIKDINLLKKLVATTDIDSVRQIYDILKSMVRRNQNALSNRTRNGYIKNIHGDLDLGHVFSENTHFTYIDFSDFDKYRIDDVSRDVGGIVLNIIEDGRWDLVNYFSNSYINQTGDKDVSELVNMQVLKKILLKYYIYMGGFDEKHKDPSKLDATIKTMNALARKGGNIL